MSFNIIKIISIFTIIFVIILYKNYKKNNYIISLTTIPSKFDNLYLTIDSIINQTITPNKIIINIPKIYSFRMNNSKIDINKINDFMSKYSKNNCIINFLDEDYGPGTKLLGLLNSNIIKSFDKSNTYIILVDDDLIYKPYMIETCDKEIKSKNIEVGSFYVSEHKKIKIGQGADCYLMKLNKLNKFLDYFNVIRENDYVKYHDDYYISFYFYLLNMNIHYIRPPNNCLIYDTHDKTYIDALSRISGKYNQIKLSDKIHDLLIDLKKKSYFNFL